MDIILNLGREDYTEILEMQRTLVDLRNSEKIGDVIIFLEHPDTYTAGIHRDRSALVDPTTPIIYIERGGAFTYHGPGQVVVYFIINLKNRGMNIKNLITTVQDAIISVLREYGIDGEGRLDKETGVWANERKLCSIGFAVKGFSSFHGIALNVSTDLSKFYRISPCGFDASVMSSIQSEIGRNVDHNEVRSRLEKEIIEKLNLRDIRVFSKLNEFQKELSELSSGTVL